MAYIPNEVVENVRSSLDIVDVVSTYINLKKAGRNFVGFCPFHAEKTPSFTVSPEKQIFYCFGCQNGGNLFSFVMQMENCSFPDAVRLLAEKSGITIDPVPATPYERKKAQTRENLQKMYMLAREHFQTLLWQTSRGKEVLEYLYKRGLSKQAITEFQLGYTGGSSDGLTGKLRKKGFDLALAFKGGLVGKSAPNRYYDYFRERLVFPVWDSRGQVIAFGGRILGPGEPKYLNSPESVLFNKSSTLYGFYMALPHIRRRKEALLVEGYMDVALLHQHGIKEAVATMGTALTEKQLSFLRGRLDKIILVFDADTAGEMAALRGLALLKNEGCHVEIAQLPPGQDPADFVTEHGEGAFRREILGRARPLVDYRLYIIKKQHDLAEEKGRVGYWKKSRTVLGEIREAVEREEHLKKIASEINISLEVLRGDLENIIRGFSNKETEKKAPLKEKQRGTTLKELVERELISCVLHYPGYMETLKKLAIGADHFTEGPYREIAGKVFALAEQGKEIKAAMLLSYFSDPQMHKLITGMLLQDNARDPEDLEKIFRDCTKKIRVLCWAKEREMLTRALSNTTNRQEMGAKLQRISDLKKREEEFYRSGEGEDFDV